LSSAGHIPGEILQQAFQVLCLRNLLRIDPKNIHNYMIVKDFLKYVAIAQM
jgi:hypothetical protein